MHMKNVFVYIFIMALMLAGCASEKPAGQAGPDGVSDMDLSNGTSGDAVTFTVGEDIGIEDITDFYYTVEDINYDACYQRYRFYVEDGKHIFFHETRERKDDYGPCTEEDTTLTGTIELTDEQWSEFFDLVSGGRVRSREESAETGDTGPWLYLYWVNDNSDIQQFSFASYGDEKAFVDFCLSIIADQPETKGEEDEEEEAITAAVTGPYGEISVEPLKGWTGMTVSADADPAKKECNGIYGLILKPEGKDSGYLDISVYDVFGVCGTGLKQYKENIAGRKVTVGIYDDHEYPDFIILKEDNPQVVAAFPGSDQWTEETWDEIYRMLDTFAYNEEKAEGGIGQYIPESESAEIAVIMSVRDVTPTGLTVHFDQYDKKEGIELTYGEGYTLEKLNGDEWKEAPMIGGEAVFTDIGYSIPPEGGSDLKTDWKWLYGTLYRGTYRITKTVLAKNKDDDSLKKYPLSAQFVIAGTSGIVKSFEVTDQDLVEEYIKDDKLVTMVPYYRMADGTWRTDDHIYDYILEVTGRLNGAARDSTYLYLSNMHDMSFEQAYKASGLSSSLEDYFDPADAILVAMK
ncbi:MAG: hypothetical protein K5886_03120 [Lachnospiraceae bacterium]|nr:hypothetical protein [Lachnospiraceae bacterium]